jgi:hypothetical protein
VRRAYRSKTPEGAPNSCYVHFLFDVICKDDGAPHSRAAEGEDVAILTPQSGRIDARTGFE